MNLTQTFDTPEPDLAPQSRRGAVLAETPDDQAAPITDPSAIYRRLGNRQRRPAWMAPAAVALILVAGGGALGFTLMNSHHTQPPLAAPTETAANQIAPPTPATPPATPATQSAPTDQAATPATPAHHEVAAAPRHAEPRLTAKAANRTASASRSTMPSTPVPYAPSANNSAADVSATQPAPVPQQPAPAAPIVAPAPSQPAAPPQASSPSPPISPAPAAPTVAPVPPPVA